MRILTLLPKLFVFLIIFGSVTFHLANGKAHAGTIYDLPDAASQVEVSALIMENETPEPPVLTESVCQNFPAQEVETSGSFLSIVFNVVAGIAIGFCGTFYSLRK